MSLGKVILDAITYISANPALILALVAIPLIVLARWKHVYATKQFVWLAFLPIIPSLSIAIPPTAFVVFVIPLFAVVIVGKLLGMLDNRVVRLVSILLLVCVMTMVTYPTVAILLVDAFILSAIVFDLLSIPRRGEFTAERTWQKTASLLKKHPVSLTITNNAARTRRIVLRDDVHQAFTATPDEFDLELQPRSRANLKYTLRASRRGAFQFDHVHIKAISRWSLWKRIIKLPCVSTINVYPDMKQLAEFEVLARTNRLSLMGVRRTRRIGQDNDFERLRDYTLDDNYKHIDWRTTARRRKLTVRDFQTSQSQRLIFMVDCGRMMTNEAAGLSLLDHSLNAMLMLSYIALRRGDSVGLVCFSDRIHSYVPPRSGAKQMSWLLRASFDRFPQLVESRYGEAFLHLSKNCRKRSLVILMTNLIDEINANQIHQYLSSMVGRHLPLGVLLRDHELFQAAETNWRDDAELYRTAAAAEIICWRHEVINQLQHQGVLSLDVFPENMTAPLINQYLEVKARHLL